MVDKIKTKTYDFLPKINDIDHILNDSSISFTYTEKKRHDGKTLKLIENNDDFGQQVSKTTNDDLTYDEIFFDALENNDVESQKVTQLQTIIEEKAQKIKQLTRQIKKLQQSKQDNINFENFKYNTITFYNEKQSKKTGIEKIYEEILSINNEMYFITTFQHTDQSITEEIIYFFQLTNGEFEIIKQIKQYQNINEYKEDALLIEKQSNKLKKVYIDCVPIKKFLKKQNYKKIKPSKKQWIIWGVFTILAIVPIICAFLPFVWPAVALVLIDKIAISAFLVTIGIGSKIFSSLFSPVTKKVESWISNKICKDEEKKATEKKERQLIIRNLKSDKQETKLQTQYDILKQELDSRKIEDANKLINNSKRIISNSNSIFEISSIESENNQQNFDSSILNTINHQDQPSISANNNWNKVKYLV